MAIRALDYTPPVHIEFRDFLSALLTADTRSARTTRSTASATICRQLPGLRDRAKPEAAGPDGFWLAARRRRLVHRFDRTRFESLTRDPDEVFRFIWENRHALGLSEGAYTRVLSVRPCLRVAPDGFPSARPWPSACRSSSSGRGRLATWGSRSPPRWPTRHR